MLESDMTKRFQKQKSWAQGSDDRKQWQEHEAQATSTRWFLKVY